MSTTERLAKSQRDGHVFITAFGMMDSDHEGEATAAFVKARQILRGRGESFRALLERLERAERLNRRLATQNRALLQENAATRARDSRPYRPGESSRTSNVKLWDIGIIALAAAATWLGLMSPSLAFGIAATALVIAAFQQPFSVGRFLTGIAAAVVVLGIFVFSRPTEPRSPVLERAVHAATAYASVAPVSRPAAEPPTVSDRSRDCRGYRVQPGYSCVGRSSWVDSYRSYDRSYDRWGGPRPPSLYRPQYWETPAWWRNMNPN